MLPNRETLLCRYHYDPLDRLVDCTPSAQAVTRRFYLKDRLATEIQGAVQRSIMQHDDRLLAQQQRQSGVADTRLLATDQQRSVLYVLDVSRPHPIAYSPYGHHPAESGLLSLLGFNGERPDPVTGCFLLGNGYRAFNPVLMRFNSPDSWSPFGEGGLNAYAYCVGDPVNGGDPTGHTPVWLKTILRSIGLMRGRPRVSPGVTPNTETPFHNPMANRLHPFPNAKSPAWTTQDQLAFAGTEARHPGAPGSATSYESLSTYSNNSPRTSNGDIQPISIQRSASTGTPPRRSSNVSAYDVHMENVTSYLRARYGNGGLITDTVGAIFDPPPSYTQSFRPPPNYGKEPLPSYEQARVNAKQMEKLSKQQIFIRRRSV
ncbi:RHS repeat-associated core domain-containing protein [Pseudomonas azerbaijanoccidentalis]|uniref:RHS repeat-associated core domain-containing protein n=1 Tax=Pseudomonas azerbaijanoccidentalis TaxID=2842347 RepID=UPI001CEDDEE3|nr:RHS repeat-associated core domain-containing protein [Pseudomonas azerbaijanoccidentalis]